MSDGAPVSQEIRLPVDVAQVTSATAKLDAMIARVEKLERTTERHHKKSEAGWEGVEKSVNKAKNRVTEFFGFIGATVAFEALEKVADKFIDIGKEAVHAAAMAQRMNFALDAAAGGKEGGNRVREFAEQNAKVSEFSVEQNKAAYLQLKRFGIDDQKAGLFMMGAEDLAAVADPARREETYQSALSGFERMHARGKIDSRSARMGFGFGVEDFATLAQFKGMNPKAINKAIESGAVNVSENDVFAMLMHRTGEKKLGQRGVEASETLLSRMTKLTQLPDRFYEKLSETAAAEKLSNAIGGILKQLDPDSPNGKKIFGALERTFDTVANAVREIDFDAVASTITDDVLPAMKLMASMIEPTVRAVEKIVHLLGLIGPAAAGPGAMLGAAALMDKHKKDAMKSTAAAAITGKTEQQLGEMGFFGRALQGAKGALHTSVGMATGGHFVPFREEFAASARERAGRAVGEGFAQGVEASMSTAESASMSLGEGSNEALRSSIDAHSPSKKAEELGLDFGDGYAAGLMRSSKQIDDAMDSTFKLPADQQVIFPKPGPSSTNLTVNVSVTTQGGEGQEAIANAIAEAVRREVIGALDVTGDE